MKKFFTIDAHEDIAFHLDFFKRDFIDPHKPCMITLPWLKKGGVRIVFNTIFVHPKYRPFKTREKAYQQLDIYNEIYTDFRDEVIPIKTKSDLAKLENSDSLIGFCTLMEGADPIYSVEELETFFRKGVRIVALSWNNRNRYASGPETSQGLTESGKELISKMNELGIMLDVSHLNENSFWDAINLTELIPIASHSNARAITDHPRNLRDDQLLAIAKKGGVIGIVFYNTFLKTSKNPPTLKDIFIHTDYIINLCGEDHVGIGTDMDGASTEEFPSDLRKISELPIVSNYFFEKGYSEKRVRKIMGENFLRVLKANLPSESV